MASLRTRDGRTLGERLFSTISDNAYLREIHESILCNYARHIFRLDPRKNRAFDVDDALTFVDLLSKSTGTDLSDVHKTRAQEMAIMLSETLGDDPRAIYSLQSALASSGNYVGLGSNSEFVPPSPLDELALTIDKGFFHMPGDDLGMFLPKQKAIFDRFSDRRFSFSAPTSMGKSMLMKIFIRDQIVRGKKKNMAIALPTKALISEISGNVIFDLQDLLEKHNYRVVTSVGSLALEGRHHYIFIVTPERLLYILNRHKELKLDILFIDEAHKLSAEDSRSVYYYKVLSTVQERNPKTSVIFASPNIPNPDVYLRTLASSSSVDPQGNDGKSVRCLYSPVNQIKFLVDLSDGSVRAYDELTKRLIDICDSSAYRNLSALVSEIGSGGMCLVYCKSKSDAVRFAREYANRLPKTTDKDLLQLAAEVRETVHEDYYLAELLEKGVAYHMGYLPANIRGKIESLYKSENIRIIFCTSTLLEGVNLPAKNLFITSPKKGTTKLSEADFKNLAGRVGRVSYDLFGNVFAVSMPTRPGSKDTINYERLMKSEIPQQHLSIETRFSDGQKKQIAEALLSGRKELERPSWVKSEDDYDFVRKATQVLLSDIVADRDSKIRREFEPAIEKSAAETIRENYKQLPNEAVDDITITLDQADGLANLIASGVSYPKLRASGAGADYDELYAFLLQLAGAFNWAKYEKGTLGHTKDGEYVRLKHYAALLNTWVSGYGLNFIIKRNLKWYDDNGRTVRLPDGRKEPYTGSREQKNQIIGDTLQEIENVILFKLSNYFLKFSEESKRQAGSIELENDWYEYIEYGTTNSLRIFLQRVGFTREATEYIKNHKLDFVVETTEGFFLRKRALIDCPNDSVAENTKQIQFNFPELFVDER